MEFNDSANVISICEQIRQADYVRGSNRARINNLFNGVKPFTSDDENPINVNFLEGTKLALDARSQFASAFMKPGNYFTLSTDAGAKHKRSIYSAIVTKEMSKIIKRDMGYFETLRSKFAMDVLHGIGPAAWENEDSWAPNAVGIEDVGIPANTLLTMKNLPFFYIYRSFTVPEIKRLTKNRKAAEGAGWNMPLVDKCIEWVDKQCCALMGNNFPTIWSPEKVAERIKGDGGFYTGDSVPTINVFDFYFWNDDGNTSGWNRRMVLDASDPGTGEGAARTNGSQEKDFMRNGFLLDTGTRKVADRLNHLISFQFADLSAVAPFKYHSVRSLGFLTYAACHLQNRMRCRFSMAAFEASMNYFRIKSSDQAERALKINMVNMGVIDETVEFVPPDQRWKVDTNIIELFLTQNKAIIESNTASFTAQPSNSPGDRKTKFQVMAEVSQATSLVGTALNQAYRYQEPEYREITRRFMKANSADPDVREFRAACLKQGVPDKVLCPECWDITPERVMGAGNKTMEMAIAEQLMQMRNLYDPEPQRDILRRVTTAITDDPSWALTLVPESPLKVTDSIHDAQLCMGTLMQGMPVAVKTGQNHKEYVQVMLQELTQMVQGIEQQGGMTSADKIQGFNAVAQGIEQHLQILGQDPEEKKFVAAAGQQLGKVMNLVRAFQQRLEEQMKQQQQQQGQDPAAAAKAQATMMQAQVKAKNSTDAHAQKMAQKQLAFDQKQALERQKFEQELHQESIKTVHEVAKGKLK
jgi:hypothetical protein